MPVTLALSWLRQENLKFKTSLGHMLSFRTTLNKQTNKSTKINILTQILRNVCPLLSKQSPSTVGVSVCQLPQLLIAWQRPLHRDSTELPGSQLLSITQAWRKPKTASSPRDSSSKPPEHWVQGLLANGHLWLHSHASTCQPVREPQVHWVSYCLASGHDPTWPSNPPWDV